MKRLALIAAFLLLPVLAFAQEETIINGDFDHGGYGGLVTKVTRINGEAAIMMGGEGAWLIDHSAYIGIQWSGLANRIDADLLQASGKPYVLRVSEVGARLGYIHNSDDVVHFTAGAIIGGGSITLSERYIWTDEGEHHHDGDQLYFLVEPEVGAEINFTNWLRAGVTASYRVVSGADYAGMTSSDVGGPAGAVTLRFGSF